MKKELTELLEKGNLAEKEFIAALTDEERNSNGTLEHWTAKDNIAHNAHWRKQHAENVLAVLTGKTPSDTDNIDHTNEAIYHQYKEQSWEEVEMLMQVSLKRMGEALNTLSEDDLQNNEFYPWEQGRPLWRELVGNMYTHVILHIADWYSKNGQTDRVVEMYQAMTGPLSALDDSPEWQGTIRYNLACSYSLAGETEKAINELAQALQMNPALKEWSQQDPDFEPIREEIGYQTLYEE